MKTLGIRAAFSVAAVVAVVACRRADTPPLRPMPTTHVEAGRFSRAAGDGPVVVLAVGVITAAVGALEQARKLKEGM